MVGFCQRMYIHTIVKQEKVLVDGPLRTANVEKRLIH